MYKYKILTRVKLINESVEGFTLESQIAKALAGKQPIEGNSKLLYTERKEGVLPGTNIRTDRFEVAIEATEKIAKSYAARREEKPNLKVVKDDGKPEPIQGKPETGTENAKAN